MEWFHERKDYILIGSLAAIHLLLLIFCFINVYENTSNGRTESIIDLIELKEFNSYSFFPLTYIFLSLMGFVGNIIFLFKKDKISRYLFIMGMSLEFIIGSYFYLLLIDNSMYLFYKFSIISFLAIGFVINIYLFKYADCKSTENDNLNYRRSVMYVIHFAYLLMLLAFLSSLTEGNFVNNVNGLQFIDIMRIITAAAIIFPVFFFKKRQFDSKVVVNIFLVSPIIWLFMVIVDDVQLEDLFRDGSIFFAFLIIVSLPLLIVNIGEIKEFLKESYKKYKIDDLNE